MYKIVFGWNRLNKENIPSRAYIAFKNEEQLAVFSREYDGHVFRDKAGQDLSLDEWKLF
jgi:regulator of nonsense transcripts 3